MPYLSYPGIFLSKPEKIVKRRKKIITFHVEKKI
jgi:hypothetical protein